MATLKDIAKILVSRHKIRNVDAEAFLQSMVEVINEGLMKDRQVKIKGFGTFKLQAMKERASVNVNTGEKVVIGEHDKISFTPDNLIKEIINKPFSQFDTVIINDETAILLENTPLPDIDTSAPADDENSVKEELVANEAIQTPTAENESEEVPVAENEEVPVPESEEVPVAENEEVPVAESEEVPVAESEEVSVAESEEVPVAESEEVSVAESEALTTEGTATRIAINPKENGEPVELIADSVRVVADTVEVVADTVKVRENNNQAEPEQPDPIIPQSPVEEFTENDSNEEETVSSDDNNTENNDNDNDNEQSIMLSLLKYGLVAVVFFIFGFFAGTVDWNDFIQHNVNKNTVVDKAVVKYDVDSALLVKDTLDVEEQEVAAETEKAADKSEKPAAEKKESAPEKESKSETAKAPAQPATEKQAEPAKDTPMTEYNKDPRVKHGAYYIVGTDQVVTVRDGQTLKSISKAYLGPDMECYVEAYNAVKEVKAGQKIKIPKLKVKKLK